MTLIAKVAVKVFIQIDIEKRPIIVRTMDIDMAIEAILVCVNPSVSRIVAGHLMTLQTELLGLLFQ